jgi:hypothetical protein
VIARYEPNKASLLTAPTTLPVTVPAGLSDPTKTK